MNAVSDEAETCPDGGHKGSWMYSSDTAFMPHL